MTEMIAQAIQIIFRHIMFRHIVFSRRNIYIFGEWIPEYAALVRQSFGRTVADSAGL